MGRRDRREELMGDIDEMESAAQQQATASVQPATAAAQIPPGAQSNTLINREVRFANVGGTPAEVEQKRAAAATAAMLVSPVVITPIKATGGHNAGLTPFKIASAHPIKGTQGFK